MKIKRPVSILVIAICTSNFSIVQAQSQEAELDELRSLIIRNMGPNIFSGSQTFSLGSNILLQIDKNDDGITGDEISSAEKISNAESRANAAGQILRYDLNANFKIEKTEAAECFEQFHAASQARLNGKSNQDATRIRDDFLTETFLGDTDGYGTLEGQELYFVPQKVGPFDGNPSYGGTMRFSIDGAKLLLKLDPNRDGVVSQSEVLMLFGRALDGVNIFLEINKYRQPIIEGGKF